MEVVGLHSTTAHVRPNVLAATFYESQLQLQLYKADTYQLELQHETVHNVGWRAYQTMVARYETQQSRQLEVA